MAAYTTLYTCLTTLLKLLAPFIPFVTEDMYQNVVRSVIPDAPESVHHNDWPSPDLSAFDKELMEDMDLAMKVSELGRSLRNTQGIRLRQPLAEAKIFAEENMLKRIERVSDLIKDELNVKELVLCVPTPKGKINPYVMAAIKLLGIKEVYRIGGAQAVGAMAYGTKTIKKVDKIVGPGNIYVATAKKMVFGVVDIDMIAGPSEIIIIADDSANPSFIAADLLGQAEHDEFASSILITDSKRIAVAVDKEIEKQLTELIRKEIARKSIDNYGAIIITKGIKDSVELSNHIAPEHLEVMTKKPTNVLPMIKNAGAIFLGEWTPEALGDYSAGPNHTLPTGGTARFSSPLGVYDFVKRSSLLSFKKEGFAKLASAVKIIAEAEGLEAHKNTIKIRECL